MCLREGIDIEAYPVVVAIPHVPKVAKRSTLPKISRGKCQHQESIENLGGPNNALKGGVLENSEVEKADGGFDHAQGEGIDDLADEVDKRSRVNLRELQSPVRLANAKFDFCATLSDAISSLVVDLDALTPGRLVGQPTRKSAHEEKDSQDLSIIFVKD